MIHQPRIQCIHVAHSIALDGFVRGWHDFWRSGVFHDDDLLMNGLVATQICNCPSTLKCVFSITRAVETRFCALRNGHILATVVFSCNGIRTGNRGNIVTLHNRISRTINDRGRRCVIPRNCEVVRNQSTTVVVECANVKGYCVLTRIGQGLLTIFQIANEVA